MLLTWRKEGNYKQSFYLTYSCFIEFMLTIYVNMLIVLIIQMMFMLIMLINQGTW